MTRTKTKHEPITGLSAAERTLLVKGLCALRDERGRQWNEACDAAEAAVRDCLGCAGTALMRSNAWHGGSVVERDRG